MSELEQEIAELERALVDAMRRVTEIDEKLARLQAQIAAQQTATLRAQQPRPWSCPICDAEWPAARLECACGYPNPAYR